MDESRRSKAIEMGYSLARDLMQNHVYMGFLPFIKRSGRDSPRMMSERLVTHTPAEIATTTLFFFHMAMLQAMVSA